LSRTLLRLGLSLLILPALLLLFACNGDDNGGGDNSPQPTLSPTSPPDLPREVPDDFPFYPSGAIISSSALANQVFVTMETDDKRNEVADFYRDALSKEPWKLSSISDIPGQQIISLNFAHLKNPVIGIMTIIGPDAEGESNEITVRFVLPESEGTPLPTSAPSPTASPEG